eukprot:scaffold4672_cov129-Isochrysis_galbana.AAC.3
MRHGPVPNNYPVGILAPASTRSPQPPILRACSCIYVRPLVSSGASGRVRAAANCQPVLASQCGELESATAEDNPRDPVAWLAGTMRFLTRDVAPLTSAAPDLECRAWPPPAAWVGGPITRPARKGKRMAGSLRELLAAVGGLRGESWPRTGFAVFIVPGNGRWRLSPMNDCGAAKCCATC